jgi:hypothetical protein
MQLRCYVVAAAVIASAACANPFGPNSRRPDPGTVVVQVRDQSGAPVPNVWVYVELPNDVGSVFLEGKPTQADGTVTHYYIPAGRRPVEIKPPAGYEAEGERRLEVDVVKGRSVTTQFTLRRM